MDTLSKCQFKIRYTSKDHAFSAINKCFRKEQLQVYECPTCQGWHMTGVKDPSTHQRLRRSYRQIRKYNITGFKMTNKSCYRDCFAPSQDEIEEYREYLIAMYGEKNISERLSAWIESEIDIRMEEGVLDNRFEKLERNRINHIKREENEKVRRSHV